MFVEPEANLPRLVFSKQLRSWTFECKNTCRNCSYYWGVHFPIGDRYRVNHDFVENQTATGLVFGLRFRFSTKETDFFSSRFFFFSFSSCFEPRSFFKQGEVRKVPGLAPLSATLFNFRARRQKHSERTLLEIFQILWLTHFLDYIKAKEPRSRCEPSFQSNIW